VLSFSTDFKIIYGIREKKSSVEELEVQRFHKRLGFLSSQNSLPPRISAPHMSGNHTSDKPLHIRSNKQFKRFKSAIKMIADAYINPGNLFFLNKFIILIINIMSSVYLPFDAVEFNGQKDKSLLQIPSIGLLDTPTTVVDCAGRIVLWYLPGLIPDKIHVCKFLILLNIVRFNN
jgi:hypothetical protein